MPQGERYTASADELIGQAQGAVRDGVLARSYLFNLKLGARQLRVHFRESFLQIEEDVVLNSARVSKCGFEIGRTTIVFRKFRALTQNRGRLRRRRYMFSDIVAV